MISLIGSFRAASTDVVTKLILRLVLSFSTVPGDAINTIQAVVEIVVGIITSVILSIESFFDLLGRLLELIFIEMPAASKDVLDTWILRIVLLVDSIYTGILTTIQMWIQMCVDLVVNSLNLISAFPDVLWGVIEGWDWEFVLSVWRLAGYLVVGFFTVIG